MQCLNPDMFKRYLQGIHETSASVSLSILSDLQRIYPHGFWLWSETFILLVETLTNS